ncbi:MAG: hypothetical protein LBQ54_08450 [Planctomycetaceae bacterium]|nr:hypothetical protein [Planctomycetaceae bacterium]
MGLPSRTMTRSRWSLVSIGRTTFPTEAEGYCDGTACSPLRKLRTCFRWSLESASGTKEKRWERGSIGGRPRSRKASAVQQHAAFGLQVERFST